MIKSNQVDQKVLKVTTKEKLRSLSNHTGVFSDKFYLQDLKEEFYYDPADTTSADNGVDIFVNIATGRRYKLWQSPATTSEIDNIIDVEIPVAVSDRLPYKTLSDLSSQTITSDNLYLTDDKKFGLFKRLSPGSPDVVDNAIIIQDVNGDKFKRQIPDWVTPEMFGAIGDGIADDTVALQKALDYAFVIKRSVRLVNIYRKTSGITTKVDVEGGGKIISTSGKLLVSQAGVSVRNIRYEGVLVSGEPVSGGVQAAWVAGVTFSGLEITNVAGAGIHLETCNRCYITGNTITNTKGTYGDGIYMGSGRDHICTDNKCYDFQRIGIVGENTTYNPTISNNICKGVHSPLGGQINAGIWVENTSGATITDNYTEDTGGRGIVCTPAVDDSLSYTYNVSGNTVKKCEWAFAFPFSAGQDLFLNNNHAIDTIHFFDMGNAQNVNIIDCSWSQSDLFIEPTSAIRLTPTTTTGLITNVNIEGFKNYVNSPQGLITIPNTSGFKMNLRIKNCTGNSAITSGANGITGDLIMDDCELDYSLYTVAPSTIYMVNFSNNVIYRNCNIKLTSLFSIYLRGLVEFNSCKLHSDAAATLTVHDAGSPVIKFIDSEITMVTLHHIRRVNTDIIIKGSRWSEYPSTGIMSGVIVKLNNLEILDSTFESTVAPTSIPVQINAAGANSVKLGNNIFTAANVLNILTMPISQPKTPVRLVSTARPTHLTTTDAGYKIYDNTINKELTWTGTVWTGQPSYFSNAATTTQTKTTLNTSYSNHMTGTVVDFPNMTGGAATFRKEDSSTTSNWIKTDWATGEITRLTT